MIHEKRILDAIDELDALRDTRRDHWQVPRVEGELLHHIALAMNARLVVEVGTSYGFSGLFWGAAMHRTGGHLHTIDQDPRKYDSAKLTFTQAGLADHITAHLGDARQIIPILPEAIDIVFLDADKESLRVYFDQIWPKLRPGGCILTDNATTHREQLSEFVSHLRNRPDASSVEVAVGNGLEWTIRR